MAPGVADILGGEVTLQRRTTSRIEESLASVNSTITMLGFERMGSQDRG
jgi:hypothetical protein